MDFLLSGLIQIEVLGLLVILPCIVLCPFVIGYKNGTRAFFTYAVYWLPILLWAIFMFMVLMGCGHGTGTGGVCDYIFIILLAPYIIGYIMYARYFNQKKLNKNKP